MTTWILSYAIGKVELGLLGIDYRQFLILQLIAVVLFARSFPFRAISPIASDGAGS